MIDAAQRGPVVIRRQSRDSAVLIWLQDYDRLRGIAVAEFETFCDRVAEKAAARGRTQARLDAWLQPDA